MALILRSLMAACMLAHAVLGCGAHHAHACPSASQVSNAAREAPAHRVCCGVRTGAGAVSDTERSDAPGEEETPGCSEGACVFRGDPSPEILVAEGAPAPASELPLPGVGTTSIACCGFPVAAETLTSHPPHKLRAALQVWIL